jgi:hypothetical protein
MASTTVVVKYGKDDLPIEIPLTGKVLAVKQQLESLTGLFVRKQKLIYKVCFGAGSCITTAVHSDQPNFSVCMTFSPG